MSDDSIRKAFEKYIKDGSNDVIPHYDEENDSYHWTGVDDLWRCWQAAWDKAIDKLQP